MLPLLFAMAQAQTSSPAVFDQTAQGDMVLRRGRSTLLRGHGAIEKWHEEHQPAKPLYLGYPHGPKDAQFVPPGTICQTLIASTKEGVDAQVFVSRDSFMCGDDQDGPLSSSYGGAGSSLNNGIYDRKGDWLLTVKGAELHVEPAGPGRFRLRTKGPTTIYFKPDYYRNHLGYFLWDNTRPVWRKPVAGWCSWMAHQQDITEADVLGAARFFAANLRDYGYDVIQIDDGYQRVMQFPKGEDAPKEPFSHYWSIPNEKFPSGLESLAHQISGLGLTPGIWVGDYLPLGLRQSDGYVTDPDGKPHKGPWVNYAMNALIPAAREEAYIQTIRDLRAQGWRYFKIDTLRHILYDSYRQIPGYWAVRGERMEDAFRTLLDETKKAAGPDSYLLACWGTMPELAGIPSGARIGEDVSPDVASMRRAAKYIAQFHYLNDVVWRNDPDYMCLRVPVEQARTWATLTSLAGGHVMVSDPVKEYDAARVDVLRRVGPPLVTKPATVVAHGPDPEFMTLNCAKGGEQWLVAARFGWGARPAQDVPVAKLGLEPGRRYLAFDFWDSRFLGVVAGSAPFEALDDGASQVVSFRPLLDHPQVLGTDRHIGQGAYELDGVTWRDSVLSGRMKRGPSREWSLYVHVPSGWQVGKVTGGRSELKGEVLKVTFPEASSSAAWQVAFISARGAH